MMKNRIEVSFIIFLATSLFGFAQSPTVHSNYIFLGHYTNAYDQGNIHLVENVDFTNFDFMIDDHVTMYQRGLWNPNFPLNNSFDLDGVPGNEEYYQEIFSTSPVNFVNLRVPSDNFIDNNGLHLQTNRINQFTYSFHKLVSPYPYRYGIYEVEAKLTEGDGFVSSWFLFSDRLPFGPQYASCEGNIPNGEYNKNWQEIDIWEMNGQDIYSNALRSDLHYTDLGLSGTGNWCDPPGPSIDPMCEKCNRAYILGNTNFDFFNEYHKFTLYWDPHYIITFIDGYVYRYWAKNEPGIKQTGYPEPVNFVDAMYMYLESKIMDRNYDLSDPLHGIPPNPPPSDELTIKSFRHWVFLPCFYNPPRNDSPIYNYINFGNRINRGLFETGDIVVVENTKIQPNVDEDNNPLWYNHGDKMIVYATKRVTLKPGFSASGSSINRNYPNYPEFFKAKIIPCSMANMGVLPTINFLNNGSTYLEQFWSNMDYKIGQSYGYSGIVPNSSTTDLSSMSQVNDESQVRIVNDEITFDPETRLNNVKIYSLDGRLVKEYSNVSGHSINCSDISQGVYMLFLNEDFYYKIWID